MSSGMPGNIYLKDTQEKVEYNKLTCLFDLQNLEHYVLLWNHFNFGGQLDRQLFEALFGCFFCGFRSTNIN